MSNILQQPQTNQYRSYYELKTQLDKIDDDLVDIKVDLSELNTRLSVLETKMDNFEKQIDKIDATLVKIEQKLDDNKKYDPKMITAVVILILMTGATLGERVYQFISMVLN